MTLKTESTSVSFNASMNSAGEEELGLPVSVQESLHWLMAYVFRDWHWT